GTGKTFITSKVIDDIQAPLSKTPTQEGFAYFYCDRNEKDRQELMPILRNLLSTSERPLKIFISSRPASEIKRDFTFLPNIEIQATDNLGDIEKFVNNRLDKRRQGQPISPSLRREIIGVLLEKSQGMFQWAYLQVEQILKAPTETDIRTRLGKLPKGLEESYNEIYDQIAEHEHTKTLVDRAFMWRMVWKFSHLSVAEYLEKNHCSGEEAHCHIAKVCLKLLL
ncbi:hypothetical protein DM02DRAFT_472445, partial [Periconia macrospinosa]